MDGGLVPAEEAKISVFDHGLLYGDGVFEGIRIYNGKIFKEPEHIKRLFESAKAIRLTIPMTPQRVSEAMHETIQANGITGDGYIRLVVTRGIGSLGISIHHTANPNVIIITDKISLYPPVHSQTKPSVVSIIASSAPASLASALASTLFK